MTTRPRPERRLDRTDPSPPSTAPTEAAVVAVFYGLFVGMAIHRTIKVRDLFVILRESIRVPLQARDKPGVFREMVQALVDADA